MNKRAEEEDQLVKVVVVRTPVAQSLAEEVSPLTTNLSLAQVVKEVPPPNCSRPPLHGAIQLQRAPNTSTSRSYTTINGL